MKFDAIVIGAGMSGLGASIRLAMAGKQVALLEKHSLAGGLNSYYQRGKRELDVGLHALTNFALPGHKKRPLMRLLRQLRIPYDQLHLEQQTHSRIAFPFGDFIFSNDIEVFKKSLQDFFPEEQAAIARFFEEVLAFGELDLALPAFTSARAKVNEFFQDPRIGEVLFCPLLLYGSAWEHDMDWPQFVVMFKAIYEQGFSRPQGGVRTIIELLRERFRVESGREIFFRKEVQEILCDQDTGCVKGVLLSNGEIWEAPLVISTMGAPETRARCPQWSQDEKERAPQVGKFSFCETMITIPQKAFHYGIHDTIIFASATDHFRYVCPDSFVDHQSAIICCPDNYHREQTAGEGMIRLTFLANPELWMKLNRGDPLYKQQKAKVFELAQEKIYQYFPQLQGEPITFKDVFTPHTVYRYTGHFQGTVYGSPDKYRSGKTRVKGLYLAGTDQGFLGIVGALLSGVTVANLYGLGGESV